MNELKNWNEVTKGLYRWVIAAGACYEIHVIDWCHDADILTADATLYIVGDWQFQSNIKSFFKRELICKGSLLECLETAVREEGEDAENEVED